MTTTLERTRVEIMVLNSLATSIQKMAPEENREGDVALISVIQDFSIAARGNLGKGERAAVASAVTTLKNTNGSDNLKQVIDRALQTLEQR